MKKRINKVLDINTFEVFKKSLSSSFVKISGLIFSLLVSIILGRTLGVEGLGVINLANRIIAILLVFSMLGFENVILKEVAIAFEKSNWSRAKNTVKTAIIFNGLFVFFIVSLIVFLSSWICEDLFNTPRLKVPLVILLIALVPQVFSRIFQSSVNGFRKIWQSNLVNETLSSVFITLGLVILLMLDIKLNVVNVALIYAIGRTLVAITMTSYWISIFPKSTKTPNHLYLNLLRVALPLLIVNATNILFSNVDIIMLGWLSDTKQVGLYSVAARLALLSTFFLQITNSAIAPKIAHLFSEGKKLELKKMVHNVTKGLIVLAILTMLGFIFLGKSILQLWGQEFVNSYLILLILSTGQFINISTGCSAILLTMCNQEKVIGKISIFFVFLNLGLNVILIAKMGAIGAAIATTVSLSFENIFKMLYAYKYTGVFTIPLKWNFKRL